MGGGFRSFKLVESNFSPENLVTKSGQQEKLYGNEITKSSSKELDLIFELLLLKSIPLNVKIDPLDKVWKLPLENTFKIIEKYNFVFAFAKKPYTQNINSDLDLIFKRIKQSDLEGTSLTLVLLEENLQSSSMKMEIEQKVSLSNLHVEVEVI